MILEIIIAIIWIGLGYFWGRQDMRSKEWSKWEDVGISHNAYDQEWYMLQQRMNTTTGKKDYHKVLIQKYGTLPQEAIEILTQKKC